MAVHSSITFLGVAIRESVENQLQPALASVRWAINRIDKELSGLPNFVLNCKQRRRPVSLRVRWRRHLCENKSAGLLLFWKHCIFHSLADAELQGRLGGDLNCLTSSGVASFAGLT